MTRERLNAWVREEVFGPILKRSFPVLYVLAFIWRRLLVRTKVIAITGSLGKTTAKECLAVVLASQGRTFRSYRNQNAPIAVALNILRIRPWHRYAVLEVAGADPGLMRRSAPLARPDVAIILNVLRTHTTAFADLAQHAIEKEQLLDALRPNGSAVLNDDDPLVSAMGKRTPSRVYRFGTGPGTDYRVSQVSAQWPGRLSFVLHHGTFSQAIDTQLVGAQWVASAAAVITAAVALGIDLGRAADALKKAEPFAGRMQPALLPNGAIVLRDDYNASIDTIEASLRVLEESKADRRVLVITDMSDFGRNRKQRLKYLAGRSAQVSDVALFIGELADYGKRRAVEAGLSPAMVHAFPSLRSAAEFLRTELRPGDLMLLKGRTTDHAARIFFAQLGQVACWKTDCDKRMLCDTCWELGMTRAEMSRATLVRPGW
jgi:UDP-N-acetylmuramoyl-tripeptide--D-alanyl-D-alanine ligase